MKISKIFPKIKIEWASHFNPDGSRRKPDPSATHGWYVKWRGTFGGGEDLRNKGLKEIRDANRRSKEAKKKKAAARKFISTFKWP
ncbi:hypothetical protein H0H93_000060 [Arthromyces matolae]|nr:hypothetical protein H0H93_000060 [Arthromyces matolae]